MTLTLPDKVSPAQPPTGDRGEFILLVAMTMAAEVLLVVLLAVATAPLPSF